MTTDIAAEIAAEGGRMAYLGHVIEHRGIVSMTAKKWDETCRERDALKAENDRLRTVPEPVIKSVERILDEESAWIARPNHDVTQRIALAATIAAHAIIAEIDRAEGKEGAEG